MAQIEFPGEPSLTVRTDPSYFATLTLGNRRSQTIVGRESARGDVVVLATRSVRRAFVDGSETDIAYFCHAWIAPAVRRGMQLARGSRFLRTVDEADPVDHSIAMILDSNAVAKSFLTSMRAPRSGVPLCRPRGKFVTYAIPLAGSGKGSGIPVRTAGEDEGSLCACVEAIATWGRRHQFAPVYTRADLTGEGILPGFRADDLYFVTRGDAIAATLGIWDITAFRSLTLAASSVRIDVLYAVALSVADEASFASLFEAVIARYASSGALFLICGAEERSAATPVFSRFAAFTMSSTVCDLSFDEGGSRVPSFDLVPHLEVATL